MYFYYMYFNSNAQLGTGSWNDKNTYSTSNRWSTDEFEGISSNDVVGSDGKWNIVGVKL